jgi:hypothetical protein
MKLFGGKKGDDKQSQGGDDEAGYYDSPQETVSLSDARPPANKTAASASSSAQQQQQARPAPAPAPRPEPEEDPRPHYGIDQAIQLMRALPVDQNVELVVQVIKTTLESLKVKVSDIINDADRKTKDLEDRVSNLKRAIADFEKEIETRKAEIARLEADHSETSSVRQRLELAEKAQQKSAVSAGPKGVAKTG